MKKLLLMFFVFTVFPALFYGNGSEEVIPEDVKPDSIPESVEELYNDIKLNTVINSTEEGFLSRSDLGFDITLNSYSDLVKNSEGEIVRNSVQDVLGNVVYESFNKGYTRFDKIMIKPSNMNEEVEAVVLFNLDIYSYYEAEKDPVTNLERRIGYSKESYLDSPLIMQIDILLGN